MPPWLRCLEMGPFPTKPAAFQTTLPNPLLCAATPSPPGLHCSTCPHLTCHHPLPSEENAITWHIPFPDSVPFLLHCLPLLLIPSFWGWIEVLGCLSNYYALLLGLPCKECPFPIVTVKFWGYMKLFTTTIFFSSKPHWPTVRFWDPNNHI